MRTTTTSACRSVSISPGEIEVVLFGYGALTGDRDERSSKSYATLATDLQVAGYRTAVLVPSAAAHCFRRTTSAHGSTACQFLVIDEPGSGRGDRMIFRATAARLGVPPQQCLLLDERRAVVAAREAGMKALEVDEEGRTVRSVTTLLLTPW